MRALFRMEDAQVVAVEDALVDHGGAATLDHEDASSSATGMAAAVWPIICVPCLGMLFPHVTMLCYVGYIANKREMSWMLWSECVLLFV